MHCTRSQDEVWVVRLQHNLREQWDVDSRRKGRRRVVVVGGSGEGGEEWQGKGGRLGAVNQGEVWGQAPTQWRVDGGS